MSFTFFTAEGFMRIKLSSQVIRSMLILVFSFSSFAAKSGEITVSSYTWSSDGAGGIKIDRVSAAVKSPGLVCEFYAQHKISGKCGVAVGIMTDKNPHIMSVKLVSTGKISSYTAQDQAAAVNSLIGTIFNKDFFQSGNITKSCLYDYTKTDGGSETYNPFDGVCSTGPIPPTPSTPSCKFAGSVIIDYGNLATDAVSGAKKTASTTITCDKDTSINIQVYDQSTKTNSVFLRKDKSLSATLTVDGADTSSDGKIIDVKANEPTPLTIDSELKTSGIPDAGEFTGSAIATISIP